MGCCKSKSASSKAQSTGQNTPLRSDAEGPGFGLQQAPAQVEQERKTCLPLIGYKVIDFGQYISAPMAAKMLADQGADVLHIDPPGGPLWNSQANSILNRNKHCIQLDLKSEAGQQEAKKYVAQADVVLENFPPGRMKKFGLDADTMLQGNPGLIYISLPGFASGDEQFQHLKAHEAIIMAAAGVYWDMGLSRTLQNINPSYSPLPLASSYSGVLAGAVAAAALYGRMNTGLGDVIEIPLASALLDTLCFNTMDVESLPLRYWGRRTIEIQRRRWEGLPMNLTFEQCENLLDPFFKTYYCKDDRPFYLVAMGHLNHVSRTLEVLGCRKEVENILPFGDLWTKDQGYQGDSVLGQYHLREPYAGQIIAVIKDRFKSKTAFEWEKLFAEIKIPASATRTTQEWVNSEHAKASGLIIKAPTAEGAMLQPGPLVWLSGSKEKASKRQTTLEEFLRARAIPDVPLKNTDESQSESRQGWLDGVKILDLANVIAAPMCCMMSARFGADVIKIDLPKPAYGPVVMVGFGLLAMRGKQSTLIDLKNPEGYKAFKQLVLWADMVVYNGIDPQLQAMGIDLRKLQEINPKVLLFHLNSFGGPLGGPRSNAIGYDDLTQSSTGIMARFGGSLKTAEEHAHIGTVDVVTGFAGLFAAVLALIQRKRTGSSEKAQTSLASCGQMVQVPYCFDGEKRGPWNEPKGACVGEHDLYSAYRCKLDVWGFFAAVGQHPWPKDIEKAKKTLEAAGIPSDKGGLEKWFKEKTFEQADRALRDAGIPFVRIGGFGDLSRDPQPEHKTFRFTTTDGKDNPSGREISYFAPCSVRSRSWKIKDLPEMDKYGQHTRSILKSIGKLGDMYVDKMVQSGAVGDSLSEVYLPDSSGVWSTAHMRVAKAKSDGDVPFRCASALSRKGSVQELCAELRSALGSAGDSMSLLVLYARAHMKAEDLSSTVQKLREEIAIPSLSIHGCTSQFGVSTDKNFTHTGICVFAICDPAGTYSVGSAVRGKQQGVVGAAVGAVAGLFGGKAEDHKAGVDAVKKAASKAGRDLKSDPPAFALLSIAGGSVEEEVLLGIQEVLADVPVFGGSCGDGPGGEPDLGITDDLQVVEGVVTITLAWPSVPVSIQMTALHSDILAEGIVTEVDSTSRTVKTINEQPAMELYRKWSDDCARNLENRQPGDPEMSIYECSAFYPLALPFKDKDNVPCYKMILPKAVKPDGSMELFAAVEKGDQLAMMAASKDNMIHAASHVTEKCSKALGGKELMGGLITFSAGCAFALDDHMPTIMKNFNGGFHGAPFAAQFTLGQQGPLALRSREDASKANQGLNWHGNLMVCFLLFGGGENKGIYCDASIALSKMTTNHSAKAPKAKSKKSSGQGKGASPSPPKDGAAKAKAAPKPKPAAKKAKA